MILQSQPLSATTATALATTGASVNCSNAAPPTVGQVWTAASATQGAWQTPTSTSTSNLTRTFNVKDNSISNLTGDGVDVWGVNITSGSAALNITGASFTSADVGKVIGVEGAGPSGAWLITTIAGYTNATNITLTANASTTVSSVFATKLYSAFYGTDDTSALQTLILSAYRDGSGIYGGNAKLIFPDALYIINGSLQNNVSVPGYESYDNAIDFNSQIYVPGLPPDAQNPYPGNRANGNMSRYRWSLTLEGETPPHFMQTAGIGLTYKTISPLSGVRIRSTIQGSGTYPSIICASGGGTALGANGVNNNKFGPDLTIENICFQYTRSSSMNSTMCGVNADRAKTFYVNRVSVVPHNFDVQDSAAPSTTTIGLIAPGAGDEPYSVISGCNVAGFKYGYLAGEHFTIRDSIAWACESGLGTISTSVQINIDMLEALACKYHISATTLGANYYSGRCTIIGSISGELEHTSYTGAWYEHVSMINDPSNYIYGHINLMPQEGYTGEAPTRPSKIGGENLRTTAIVPFASWVEHTGTTYTLQYLYEAQQEHFFNNAAAITLTVPAGNTATVAGYCYNYDVGAVIKCMQNGAGQVTPVGAAGVTLRFPTGKTKSSGQYSCFFLKKVSTNAWYVYGDLA
jgi:hypothetical protein